LGFIICVIIFNFFFQVDTFHKNWTQKLVRKEKDQNEEVCLSLNKSVVCTENKLHLIHTGTDPGFFSGGLGVGVPITIEFFFLLKLYAKERERERERNTSQNLTILFSGGGGGMVFAKT
jgi:uncharacterized membrane protein YciS (DUF1049 family)